MAAATKRPPMLVGRVAIAREAASSIRLDKESTQLDTLEQRALRDKQHRRCVEVNRLLMLIKSKADSERYAVDTFHDKMDVESLKCMVEELDRLLTDLAKVLAT